jgi:Ni/Fe-hydrogenase subunit HybB-like protein
MTTAPHRKSRTNLKVWAVVFLLLVIPTSFYQMYPDHPLWLAYLLAPLMLVQGLASGESVVVGHLLLLAAAFLMLLGTSWVIHCLVISIWSRKHEG